MTSAGKRPQKKLDKKAARNTKFGKATIRSPRQQMLAIQELIGPALQHHAAGRLSQAENIYQQILQADPNQPDALHMLGVIAHQEGKNDIAIDLIAKALAIKPDYVEARNNLGNALLDLGRLDEAVTSYHKAIEIKPEYVDAHYNLGKAFQDLGKLDEAVASFHKAIAIQPDFAEAHSNLGNTLKQLGRLDEAVTSYHKAIVIKPNFAEAHYNLGNVLKDLGKLVEAVASFHKAIAIQPEFAIAHYNLGKSFHGLGRLDEAVTNYQKAIAIKPGFAEAHYNFGNVLKDLGKLDEAATSYHNALSIKPDFAEAHNNLGTVRQDMGKLDETVASYHKAITIKPEFAEAHSNLGNALKKLGRLDEAVTSYQKAIAIKPGFAEAHYNLGIVLNDLGKLDEAVASYHKAITIKPDYAMAHSNLGIVLQALGKLDEAVASYNKALSIKPDHAEAHNNLGNALEELGRSTEARAAIDQAFHITHGGPWWNAETFSNGENESITPTDGEMFTSSFKLRDNIDQLEYLINKGRINPSFHRLADRYRAVLAEMPPSEEPAAVTRLTPRQLKLLGSSYNRVIYYAGAPRIDTGTVNGFLDFKQIEDRYLSSPVSVTTLDDFLMLEALQKLRDFCLESTIFFACSGNRYVESSLSSGFNCELLYQMSEELRERFPMVLGGHYLANIWIYRYNNQSVGVSPHTDEGAVTFNFWITPDDANRIPDRGGLVVYTKEQPYNWDWLYYNRYKYTPAVSREIAAFLTDADTVTIPYRDNRAVLFHSNLFHKSDQIHFRDGFESRRMNITLLFGKREC